MIRKLLLTLTVLFVLPTFANAWYVNAKTSPATGQGTISPSGNQSYPAGSNSGEYTVTPAPGYTVFRVTLDGANISPNANGKYVAPYVASKAWRYMVAYFTGNTVSITTQITGGSGAIREDTFESLTNIPVGSNRQLLVIPNPGYAIASVTAAGATSIIDNADGTKTVIYTNLQASQTVSASFSLIPVVTVSAGQDVTANGAGAEFAATLYGSATSNQGAITYAWSGAGLSFGTPDAAITTVYAATPGTYTATLTVTSGGIVKTGQRDRDRPRPHGIPGGTLHQLPLVKHSAGRFRLRCLAPQGQPGQLPGLPYFCTAHRQSSRPVSIATVSVIPGASPGLRRDLSHNAYTETNQCLTCHDPHKASGGNCASLSRLSAGHRFPSETLWRQPGSRAGYGDTRIAKDFGPDGTSYIFGCGNCHPMDATKHRNGAVEVELYNPAGSGRIAQGPEPGRPLHMSPGQNGLHGQQRNHLYQRDVQQCLLSQLQ